MSEHESSHYVDWDAKVDHIFGPTVGVEGWRECDRGPEYVRFTNGDEVVHFTRIKLLNGTLYIVQVPNGPNGADTVFQGKSEDIARNNALGVMME